MKIPQNEPPVINESCRGIYLAEISWDYPLLSMIVACNLYRPDNGCCQFWICRGRMSLVLYYLWFCGDQCIAGPGLYCTSYLISPELDHHMRYEGEQHQNGGIPVTNLSGELRLQIRSWIASVSARGQLGHCIIAWWGQLGHCIIAWWYLNTWEVRFYPIVWCLLIQGEMGGGSIAGVSGSTRRGRNHCLWS